uniref:Unannotated protein n=1 Tax=freshwater metagenome TaxID=449393 RepID=A0A6J5ZZQ7_9ZZZZ
MDTHRIDVLDRADDHAVVLAVAHHFELELAPAEDRLVQQHLTDWRGFNSPADNRPVLLLVAGDAPAASAQREGRPDNCREPDVGQCGHRLVQGCRDRAARHLQPGFSHRFGEPLAVLGAVNRLVVGADQLDREALERAVLGERLGEVERCLAAKRGQQRVRALLLNHCGNRPGQQRLDIGRIGELGVGHDRRRIGIDENYLVALLAQHLAGLDSGVVELGGLTDNDRPRADHEDLFDVVAPRHQLPPCAIVSTNSSKRCRAS